MTDVRPMMFVCRCVIFRTLEVLCALCACVGRVGVRPCFSPHHEQSVHVSLVCGNDFFTRPFRTLQDACDGAGTTGPPTTSPREHGRLHWHGPRQRPTPYIVQLTLITLYSCTSLLIVVPWLYSWACSARQYQPAPLLAWPMHLDCSRRRPFRPVHMAATNGLVRLASDRIHSVRFAGAGCRPTHGYRRIAHRRELRVCRTCGNTFCNYQASSCDA